MILKSWNLLWTTFNALLSPNCVPTSEGVIAYYWSQFDIPATDLEMLPEFSEERILDALESGIQKQRRGIQPNDVKIIEITASG